MGKQKPPHIDEKHHSANKIPTKRIYIIVISE